VSVATEAPARLDAGPPTGRSGGGGGDGGGGGGWSGGRDHGGDDAERRQAAARLVVVGMWVALLPILMLFLAFVSAYVVRQGLGSGWLAVALPQLVWVNTVVLVMSSLSLERGRRQLMTAEQGAALASGVSGSRAQPWLSVTLALGVLFVIGQAIAWQQLRGQGVGMSTSPYSAFFYLLTGTHAVHLAGGLLGLGAAVFWPERGFRNLTRAVAVKVAAIYWHFMGALWLGLLLLLVFRR
jgi:cytochrome c oxidase subunit 3